MTPPGADAEETAHDRMLGRIISKVENGELSVEGGIVEKLPVTMEAVVSSAPLSVRSITSEEADTSIPPEKVANSILQASFQNASAKVRAIEAREQEERRSKQSVGEKSSEPATPSGKKVVGKELF